MANEENLIQNHERTPTERRENARKAGIASGEARRRKANLKRTMETLLRMDVPDAKLKMQLESMGLDPSLEQALSFSVLLKAVQKGDYKAFETIRKAVGQDETLLDRQEQKARADKLKIDAQKAQAEIVGNPAEDSKDFKIDYISKYLSDENQDDE